MEKINISLAGCGFLGIYHIGVASCIKEYAPHLLLNKVSGASIGALAGCCLLTDVSLGVFTSEMLHIIYEIRHRALGPFNPLINVQSMLRNILINHIPKNAYETVRGRLFISMTKINDGSNFLVSDFNSNDELMDALLASAFVPFFSGFIPPKFRGSRYIDGGFSNNLPILDENTVTVSPFCGESDICPRDSTLQLFHINLCNTSVELSTPNFYRFARILFPPSVEVLSNMCKQGFDDALKFLQRNNMISCTKCLTVQRTISLPIDKHRRQVDQHETYDPQCEECTDHMKKAADSNLPEPVLSNFEQSIEMANKELASLIYRIRRKKIISAMILPCFLTADIIRAVLKKFADNAPYFIENISLWSEYLLKIIINTLNKMNRTGLFLASKMFGPLSFSISIDKKEKVSRPKVDAPAKSKVSLQFEFDPDISVKQMESDMVKDSETIIVHSDENADVTDDTYEHLVEVIDQHEALMAFYYLDDRDKMTLVEFYNCPPRAVDDDAQSVCSTNEDNQQINISSDPESEWSHSNKKDENPEAEQRFKKKSIRKTKNIATKE